jgi:NADPH:quinone reductase-like Zn-dependent oxidoreductase
MSMPEEGYPYPMPMTLCLNGMISPGLGTDGAMAEYMLVDSSRHLVPIEDLDPVRAASLTDAALTPYQAIKSVLPDWSVDRPRWSSAPVVWGTSPFSFSVSSPRPG